jgi:hypothetical protein
LYLLAVVVVIEVFSKYKKHAKAKLISYIALVIGIGVYVATLVGTSGEGLFVILKLEDTATFSSEDTVRPANVIGKEEKK